MKAILAAMAIAAAADSQMATLSQEFSYRNPAHQGSRNGRRGKCHMFYQNALIKRRAKNKMARKSRRNNRK